MPRFFVSGDAVTDTEIVISGGDAFHIARSLRMAEGDELTVCDDAGIEYTCRLTRIRDSECRLEILDKRDGIGEPPAEITLYMGYPKGDKLEIVVQKAVELGCYRIVPFESSRCVKRPNGDRVEKQTARLCRIAEEAAKQCGRARIPEVSSPIKYSDMLTCAKSCDRVLFCYEGEGTLSLKKALSEAQNAKTIAVIVGSEGGFSKEEAELAKDAGHTLVNLGPRILRCETAPLYALAAISYELEL